MSVVEVDEARAAEGAAPPAGAGIALPATLRILFGTEMGNAELVADNLGDALGARGVETECVALNDQPVDELAGLGVVLIVTSTSGEGDMPYTADKFWRSLTAADAPSLAGLHYAVLALGDSGYTYFCEAGVRVDARFAELGATRIADRVDCDVSYVEPSDAWIAARVAQLVPAPGGADVAPDPAPRPAAASTSPVPSPWTRDTPFEATLTAARLLSAPGSAKEIRHYELDLSGSGIDYQPGDSLAVVPVNDPVAVDRFLAAAGLSGSESYDGEPVRSLAEQRWELRFPSGRLLDVVASRAPETALGRGMTADGHAAGEEWVRTRSVSETLRELPVPLPLDELGPLMTPIRYRAYSIASSPRTHPDQVHLMVATQRNAGDAALPSGVGSGFLADRVRPGDTVRVFPFPNRTFRLPADPATPIVMIGPGVGVAPFRGFLADRAQHEDRGPAWLFYGDQHEATDFSYRDEWEALLADGVLTRLDTAFSRDGARKLYVQDRMREHGAELVRWLRDGAHLYVCGDGKRMAADVDAALLELAVAELGETAGAELVERLNHEKRYLRDVY
ncbi:diflavin oxidoreductase [Microbacterium sp. No. 7]|uniref:diflavin oxidoreductase n=1 Tax=Microbacterium sp. No. 7 TaxID=1714373 RepID=UPI0006ED0ADA|nr:flavodoxin domain-containing protein [Microbacterium sp. No. 7]ALJ21954.1 hypothetical protein AOA12_19470 [Microbacterium sp. No. 7]